MYPKLLAATALVVCCFSAACGGVTDPSQNATETFSGVLNHGGPIQFFGFTSSKTGEISAKFTSLTPVSQAIVGVLLAQAGSGGSCAGDLGLVNRNDFAQLNVSVFLGQLPGRQYCIGVYESQTLTQAENFTVTVSHP
ncbi:MAG TPA: hypothetical protein VKE96_11850 [Vicinamibacterales bacterium]|nr:hypothetical protein [Vicinamibacterales bacterium]